jgi:HPt (histidine-containing phosphotransfer) domain-containing protein
MTDLPAVAGELPTELPSTDPAALERLHRFGGGKLLGEMIALFLASAPERLAAARAGLEGGDVPAAELALHSLKSSSAQLGALRMQRLSEQGEHLARAGNIDIVSLLVSDLETEYEQVRRWLERVRDGETA